MTVPKLYQAFFDWLLHSASADEQITFESQVTLFPKHLKMPFHQHHQSKAFQYALATLEKHALTITQIINSNATTDKAANIVVKLSQVSDLWQKISDAIKHVIAKADILFEDEKARQYVNDPGCLEELYKFVCLAANKQDDSPTQTMHGILKTDKGTPQPNGIVFQDQQCVKESDNPQLVQASWLQEQISGFFDQRRSIILLPTELEASPTGQLWEVTFDHLLDTPGREKQP